MKTFEEALKPYPIGTADEVVTSCIDPIIECLMTQYVPVFGTLGKYIDNLNSSALSSNEVNSRVIELVGILHMIYGSLSLYRENYTHYDLHPANVVLCQLKSKYVIVEFIHQGKTYNVFTRLFPIIIDYGRNFFDIKEHKVSEILEQLCRNENVCKHRCGNAVGYAYHSSKDKSFIEPSHKNISHDLRLAKETLEGIDFRKWNTELEVSRWLLNQRTENIIKYDGDYGTKEMESKNDGRIYNVEDMYLSLKELINGSEFQKLNQALFMKWKNIGTLTIDLDHKFTPFKWKYNPEYN